MDNTNKHGGLRNGAGRPKEKEQKKAFKITEKERQIIEKIRTLEPDNLRFINHDLESRFRASEMKKQHKRERLEKLKNSK